MPERIWEGVPLPVQPPVQQQIKGWFDAVLALGLKVKDRETRSHNLRVARLCVHIGRQLSMSAYELRVLARAGLMHDIGKLGIPDAVLGKHSACSITTRGSTAAATRTACRRRRSPSRHGSLRWPTHMTR